MDSTALQLVFDAIGTGGETMARLIEMGLIKAGCLDITLKARLLLRKTTSLKTLNESIFADTVMSCDKREKPLLKISRKGFPYCFISSNSYLLQ